MDDSARDDPVQDAVEEIFDLFALSLQNGFKSPRWDVPEKESTSGADWVASTLDRRLVEDPNDDFSDEIEAAASFTESRYPGDSGKKAMVELRAEIAKAKRRYEDRVPLEFELIRDTTSVAAQIKKTDDGRFELSWHIQRSVTNAEQHKSDIRGGFNTADAAVEFFREEAVNWGIYPTDVTFHRKGD